MSKVIFLTDRRQADLAAPSADLPPAGEPARDVRARPLRDLRISVTDRCNFRCTYCMPREVFDSSYAFMPHSALLSFEEITRLAAQFARLGVEKIRLTGGEPLLRKNIETLVGMLAELRTPAGRPLDLTLTTNGSLLARKAAALKQAGLSRVTVSLDALDAALFARMSDSNFSPDDVLRGIDAAAEAGLAPVKVNMVVRRGLNDGEILPMARRFRGSGHILRFIEYMDVGSTNGWNLSEVVPSDEVLARIAEHHPLAPLDTPVMGRVAERWRYDDGGGEIGAISSVTHAFCSGCTRARLSPEGRLFLCLFASHGHDLRAPLREGADDDSLARILTGIWGQRDDNYSERRGQGGGAADRIEMSYIGG
ncbi:molybdenum cofactor biosynthesis protein [Bordetella pertussis]|uniref:GTP 3',8-cyclase n=7 Tax=Bordetella pertussis TaxID=520 RepID=Q7VVG3_BORPE|nr:GTP 3',8-cyclase MoaA [Bordetella pertussis]ETH40312.1 molybdenum cofactor biosynthesis protein A [Bordetella pertussis H918]ETH44186.1 molybdenum cofactor biosynthesis protein A [Bordetella pertussis H939]ETH47564.1 molybdenum cofactor biosynthesis protein A [Bordetella pertussis H921]ETH71200.1 molybdenum cofactor biosynthesis protein A [Bordetella pertussis STO1-CHLA-0011]ETH82057.1 molybdenum cofactor biosynthesis protein A [Bordetella pertussis STO1-CHOC-0017]ETH88015.1 molybdenum cof